MQQLPQPHQQQQPQQAQHMPPHPSQQHNINVGYPSRPMNGPPGGHAGHAMPMPMAHQHPQQQQQHQRMPLSQTGFAPGGPMMHPMSSPEQAQQAPHHMGLQQMLRPPPLAVSQQQRTGPPPSPIDGSFVPLFGLELPQISNGNSPLSGVDWSLPHHHGSGTIGPGSAPGSGGLHPRSQFSLPSPMGSMGDGGPSSLFGISAVHPQHAQHGGFFGDGMGSAPGSTFSYLKARNFFLPKA